MIGFVIGSVCDERWRNVKDVTVQAFSWKVFLVDSFPLGEVYMCLYRNMTENFGGKICWGKVERKCEMQRGRERKEKENDGGLLESLFFFFFSLFDPKS